MYKNERVFIIIKLNHLCFAPTLNIQNSKIEVEINRNMFNSETNSSLNLNKSKVNLLFQCKSNTNTSLTNNNYDNNDNTDEYYNYYSLNIVKKISTRDAEITLISPYCKNNYHKF